MFKVNNRNTRTRSEICSKLKIKTTERRYWQILFSCISIAKETEKHKSGVRQKHSQPLLCQLQRGKIKYFIFTLLYGKLLKTEVLLAIRKKFILKVSFLILNTILHFLNVYEHLAVSFVELKRSGSRVGHLHFFCLHWITCLSISTTTQA